MDRGGGRGPERGLLVELDAGEAAAIPLAQHLHATLLCDDAAARATARRRGLAVVGTLGVLLRAKREGHLDAIKPTVARMTGLGMFIGEALLAEALDAAGEAES